MKDKNKIIADKILSYTNEILSYVDGMSFNEFTSDTRTINACAFLIGQIGESIKKLSDDFINKNAEIPWRNIRGMRNRIIHDYESIDLEILWVTSSENIKILANQLECILQIDDKESSES